MADDLDLWLTAARNDEDREAFAQVVDNCQHLLRATMIRETADPDLADEIVPEALVRAWAKRHHKARKLGRHFAKLSTDRRHAASSQ